MTTRTAELAMAIVFLLLSLGIMLKSTELFIGWVPGRGPGAGAWPFWLSVGMALASAWTIVRWWLRLTPPSRSEDPFIEPGYAPIVLITVAALLGMLIAIHFVGMYLGLAAFLLFYLKVVGRHGWGLSLAFTIGTPIFVFCLFEWALTTSLPKGLPVFEPLYYPLYDIIY